MRDYQAKNPNNNPYYIESRLAYLQTLNFIRRYYERKEAADNYLENSPDPPDGLPHGANTGDATSQVAAKREQYIDDNRIVEAAFKLVPDKHREALWMNIVDGIPYNNISMYDVADKMTISRWRGRIIWEVGKNAKIL